MKTLFSVLFVALFTGAALANEPTPADAAPQSVLVAPTQAEMPAVTAPSAVRDCNACVSEGSTTCRSSCREGLFGRTIARTRTVTRNTVRAVVEVPVRIVNAPMRAFRACRGNSCR